MWDREVLFNIQYDGSKFYGIQKQPGRETIIEELSKYIRKIAPENTFKFVPSSRTDARVHALDNYIYFKYRGSFSNELLLEFKESLPPSIKIKNFYKFPHKFPFIAASKEKTYWYVFTNNEVEINPKEYCTNIVEPIDFSLIESSLQTFVGEHDFSNFQMASNKKNMVREVSRVEYFQKENLNILGQNLKNIHIISVSGKGFLRRMVRIIVGTYINKGLGKITDEEISSALNEPLVQRFVGFNMPAGGLYLMESKFDQKLIELNLNDAHSF